MEQRPTWLVRQEHGVLAEARTRSFLMDRFWVLERSVDVDGADFIVQRKLTARSLLDRTPPRLGFVQAKFYKDAATTQYVHREYVVDEAGQPRAEFFLICHTGIEDAARAYFLAASEIVSGFEETGIAHSRPGRFALPGHAVLIQRFEIIDRASVLDRVERALRDADFDRNRSFLSWALPGRTAPLRPIAAMYEEPIDNWWGDIPTGFETLRAAVRRAQDNLRDVFERLVEIEETDDAAQALELAEELKHAWGTSVSLSRDLYPADLHTVVSEHKRRYDELQAAGLLGAHAALRRTGLAFLIGDLAPRMPMSREDVYILEVRYDGETLLRPRFEGRCETSATSEASPSDRPEDFYLGVRTTQAGKVEVHCRFGWYVYPDSGEAVAEQIREMCESVVGKLCSTVLELRFGR
ncbi:MAG TPA: hypothetical protein VI485_20870 [Vicinamibacterales bacterium]|nr:hypothetical protein [Vicinamibacterales bacterium]